MALGEPGIDLNVERNTYKDSAPFQENGTGIPGRKKKIPTLIFPGSVHVWVVLLLYKDFRNKPQASPQMSQPDGKTGSILTSLTPGVPEFYQSLSQRAPTPSASISKTGTEETIIQ